MMYRVSFASMLLVILPSYIHGYGLTDLKKIYSDFWEWRKLESPNFMSYLRIYGHNDLLKSYNVSKFDENKMKVDNFLQRLNEINHENLPDRDQIEYDIFKDSITTYIDGYHWRYYQSLNPISFMEGLQTNPTYISKGLPFESRGDYENYIDRLTRLPTQFNEIKESFTEAINKNHTYHIVSVQKVPGQIKNLLKSDVKKFVLYEPLLGKLDNITWISDIQKEDLRKRASDACSKLMDTWRDLADFLTNTYFKKTRSTHGVHGWDHGKEFYKAVLKWHLSLDIKPEEVHNIGRREVKRISDDMKTIFRKIGQTGTVREFFEAMKNKTEFTFDSKNAILHEYEDVLYHRIYPKLTKLFNKIPENNVSIVPLPYDGAQGLYSSGSGDDAQFKVNLFRPKADLKFTFMALSLHEAVPGHHMQITIQNNNANIPKYRRYLEIRDFYLPPFQLPYYTAFVEGWGLYSEFLGQELGLYKDEYEMMGRYSFEIFRACRLVVDTGIHYFKWTREQAIDYMMNYTILSRDLVANDVERYITWPGQACAYKIGEIKIKEFRKKAENELGDRFNIKDFHDVFLRNGPMPLRIVEQNYNKWIKSEKESIRSSPVCKSPTTYLSLFTLICCVFISYRLRVH